jgi:hypothetical protein
VARAELLGRPHIEQHRVAAPYPSAEHCRGDRRKVVALGAVLVKGAVEGRKLARGHAIGEHTDGVKPSSGDFERASDRRN